MPFSVKIFLLFSPLLLATIMVYENLTIKFIPEYENIDFNDNEAVTAMKREVAQVYLRRERTDAVELQNMSINGKYFEGFVRVAKNGSVPLKDYPKVRKRYRIVENDLPDLASHRRMVRLNINE
jgi:hypothetical protein